MKTLREMLKAGATSITEGELVWLVTEVKRLRGLLKRSTMPVPSMEDYEQLQTVIAKNCDPTNATEKDAKLIHECYSHWEDRTMELTSGEESVEVEAKKTETLDQVLPNNEVF